MATGAIGVVLALVGLALLVHKYFAHIVFLLGYAEFALNSWTSCEHALFAGWGRRFPGQEDFGEHGFGAWKWSPRILAGSPCPG